MDDWFVQTRRPEDADHNRRESASPPPEPMAANARSAGTSGHSAETSRNEPSSQQDVASDEPETMPLAAVTSPSGVSETTDAQETPSGRLRWRARRARHDNRDHEAPSERGDYGGWHDEAWNAGWEEGSWDTGWATDYHPAVGFADLDDFDGAATDAGNGKHHGDDEDIFASSLGTLARLGIAHRPIRRVERLRLLLRRRPAAAAMLTFFLLAFMLTCCAPLIPVLRLGYDAVDVSHRVSALKELVAGDPTQLMSASKLQEARAQIEGIQHDLYEINGAMNVVGAPLGAVSRSAQNYRLLVRMGLDLTTAADGGLQVAQTILAPVQGGVISNTTGTPGITPASIQRARVALADAQAHLIDANQAYGQLDQKSLPDQFKPNTTVGKILAMMPTALQAMDEIKTLLDVAPALLGVGQPAYYLVAAMDTTELRPGGGFTGNYGILALDGGKQAKDMPLSLHNTYLLDQKFYQNALEPYRIQQNVKTVADVKGCESLGPQPPDYYWWWPYRNFDTTCKYGWGLRDANLSPSFPDNARTMMQIVEQAGGEVPTGAPIQGVIAFTPGLIKGLIKITGEIVVPQFNVTVNADNLEYMIHKYQLTDAQPRTGDRKTFTHLLSAAMLAKLTTLHGGALKALVTVGQDALKSKDLQIYFADPRVELILRQLGLSSEVRTGSGDGYMVVDTNDGGNKANGYVTETQTDLVTLLPNGGAIHRLQIVVAYNKGKFSVYPGNTQSDDYSDFQRTYLPGDATILGMSGYNPNTFGPAGCQYSGVNGYGTVISDCPPEHAIVNPVTVSDVPGRTMVGGALLVLCGQYDVFTSTDQEFPSCETKPKAHTQTIYISWYTPNAYTRHADGHFSYTEVVEHQAGNPQTLTVYVDTSQVRNPQAKPGGTTNDYTIHGDTPDARDAAFTTLLNALTTSSSLTKIFEGPLTQDQTVTYRF